MISDLLAYILESDVAVPTLVHQDLETEIASYWANETDSHIRRLNDAIPDLATTIPLFFHEDGVPHWQCQTGTFWSWSSPCSRKGAWLSRNTVVGLLTSQITKNTRKAILKVIAWDLEALKIGIRPSTDHNGLPLQGKRAQMAGKPIYQDLNGFESAVSAIFQTITRTYFYTYVFIV